MRWICFFWRNMAKHLILSFLIVLFIPFWLAGATYTVDEIPNVHVADSSAYVADPDGILSAAEVQRINTLMRDVRRTTSAEPMFVIVGNIDPEDIDGFATDLFSKWGLGKSVNLPALRTERKEAPSRVRRDPSSWCARRDLNPHVRKGH